MENIQAQLTELLGPNALIILVGLIGFFLVLVTLPVLLKKDDDPLNRLKASTHSTDKKTAKGEKLRTASSKDKLEKYSSFLEPQNEDEYSAVKLKLLQAGYRGKTAVRTYNFLQLTLGIFGLALGGMYAVFKMSQGEVSSQDLALMILGPAGAGYFLPKYWVTRRQAVRQEAITNGFPDALDLMLVCVEAGQSLDQSIMRVATELRSGFPDISDEFEMVGQETKAGKDKTTVLKDMAERCGVQDITSFVTVLVQSQQFGTSISDALRVYSLEMRDKRVMRAEEKANKLPTKMTLATMMLTVPPLMAILIGPSIYAIAKNLG
ncbi:type II secretion system F family protein [Loktanella sp. D2R18]|uniref:type II secretion system F family protein n=1 Tax=Rhodobacterales TaxID=204455 RepID=UPI000DEAECAA|nr:MULTISPECIES: type II secretion system F family protein [Rhodobacterales]MDO6590101.1 type II secretion system F family protein [Yoonia sp. 1_MG-2023]RBW45778.1 type II secretion system F family protein [Loktanella sp. D2R18]